MKPLPPVSSAEHHGGNAYRGPGAWKRPRKQYFSVREGPLDLGRIIGNLERQQRGVFSQRYGARNSFKQGKAAALQARLESLSLTLAPPYGVEKSIPSATATSLEGCHHHVSDNMSNVLPHECKPKRINVEPLPQQHQHQHQHYPARGIDEDLHGDSVRGGAVLNGSSKSSGQHASLTAPVLAGTAVALNHNHVARVDDTQQRHISLPSSGSPSVRAPHAPSLEALRIPNAATKMSVDDRCTSEILGSQATIRALLKEQKNLGDDMQRRRLEACLGDGGAASESVGLRRRRGKPTGHDGRRARRKDQLRKLKGEGGTGGGERRVTKRVARAHPLLFMAEADIQKSELDQMRLEDAGAAILAKYVMHNSSIRVSRAKACHPRECYRLPHRKSNTVSRSSDDIHYYPYFWKFQ